MADCDFNSHNISDAAPNIPLSEDIWPKTREMPLTLHSPIPPTHYPKFCISIYSDIGGRKQQEDRFTFCPCLVQNRHDCSFFGVFDGTVGDFASDTVKNLVIPHLLEAPDWPHVEHYIHSLDSSNISSSLSRVIEQMYIGADNTLVEMCAELRKDYASSTSVTAILAGDFIGVGHLGDSRIAMGRCTSQGIEGEFLTVDHKPDMVEERQRILRNGGSVEYLHNHNNKPFIRGGDFSVRKARGEQPMQLQYSRAFGGKDLKTYGLSNRPDVRIIKLAREHYCMILATDGLWDVLNAQDAVTITAHATREGRNPAQVLVEHTLMDQQNRGQSPDNITAMVVVFKH